MTRAVKFNELGRRIGESHPRAVLSDHEIELVIDFLSEREALIARMTTEGRTRAEIDIALAVACLSYRCLALKFEVHKQTIAKIACGARRCQTPAKVKPYP